MTRALPATRAASAPPDFAARVIAWQRVHGRHDLPWQNTRDAYRIWLSEIMLQQTQVATALPYYARFVAAFPSVDALAAAPLARALELWSGLGYYRRAHHAHAAACSVVARHRGRFPADAATLATLPGVGRSTAAAIAAFASGERGAILDGNVKRVIARHRGVEGWPGEPKVQAELWRAAEALLPAADLGEASGASTDDEREIAAYTQGMMDLGAMICTRVRPHCDACPVHDDCVARRDARVDTLPAPRPRKTLPRRAVRLLVLECNGRILLEQRPPSGIWSGLWSFPEMSLDADVVTHVATRFGLVAASRHELPAVRHAFTHLELTMHPLRMPIAASRIASLAPGVEWFDREAALVRALPAPIRSLLQSIAAPAPAFPDTPPVAAGGVNAATNPPSLADRRAGVHRRR